MDIGEIFGDENNNNFCLPLEAAIVMLAL